MITETTGPVARAEVDALLLQLDALRDRAAEHGQAGYEMVLGLAMCSLSDNVDAIDGWDDDAG